MIINKYHRTKNTCTLYIDDVRRAEKILNCLNLINKYATDNDIYFELFRVDGTNLRKEVFEAYTKEIEEYFNKLVDFDVLKKREGTTPAEGILMAVGKLPQSSDIYEIFPKLFDYYLATTIYKSKLNSFDDFKQFFSDNPMKESAYYIENNISDIAFSHVDSGDFMICFNTNIYNETDIINEIKDVLN